jgi:Lipase
MHLIDLNSVQLEKEHEPLFDPINDMFFVLFTRDNPTVGQRITFDVASITSSNWRRNHGTRFLIHGWTANENSPENPRTRDAFLELADHNVVGNHQNDIKECIYNYLNCTSGGLERWRSISQLHHF